jgi:hypothetical protein
VSDGLDRELGGVGHIAARDPTFVIGHVVDPVRDGHGELAQSAIREVVHLDAFGFAL